MNALRATEVWVFPYFRLGERIRIGPWELIPADALEPGECASEHALDQIRGLLEVYRRPRRVQGGFGCVLRRGRTQVGASPRIWNVTMLRTLDVYVHLLDEYVPEPAFFDRIGRPCDRPSEVMCMPESV